ncbi:MAG: geranylgeranylglycerol-phosphate geranylgeranyltransferase [bacterium]
MPITGKFNLFLAYMRLVRIQNLIIIALTQVLMRYAVVEPLLNYYGFKLQLPLHIFLMVMMATVMLTAAGYVINDYFDTRTDILNRPSKVVVDTRIHRRKAMILHVILNLTGIGLGIYVSFHVGLPALSFIFLLVTGILWFYSTSYKRQFLIGNLIVAILTALVPFMVILFEIPALNEYYSLVLKDDIVNFKYIIIWVGGFSIFAFLLTLAREIVKDIEDFEGDKAYGRDTLPIVLGVFTTKIVLLLLCLVVITLIYYTVFFYINDIITWIYASLAIVLPLIFTMAILIRARKQKHYHLISQMLKIVMLTGIFYSFLIDYLIDKFKGI